MKIYKITVENLIDNAQIMFNKHCAEWYPSSLSDEQKEKFETFYLRGFTDGYKYCNQINKNNSEKE